MINQKNALKGAVVVSCLSAALLLSGCDDDNYAQLRVLHASPDAPKVNVKINEKTEISQLDYAESSGYFDVKTGKRDITVEAIIPSGSSEVISVENFMFEMNKDYTVLAVDNTIDIEPLLASDSSTDPNSNEVSLVVIHASPDAAMVDVYVTDPSLASLDTVMPTFSFDFKDSIDAGALPAGSYRIRVTAPNSKTPLYDSGTVDLSPFSGQKLMVAAISTINSTQQAASPIQLLVANDDTSLSLLDSDTMTGARVAHLSADADMVASGPVEVFASSTALPVSPTELIDAFSYTDIVPGTSGYVAVPAGAYTFDVALDTDSIGDSVYTSPELAISAGSEYSVIASGLVSMTPAFELLATEDSNRSIITQASVKVVHAAPAAGSVDVFVTEAGTYTTADVESGVAGAPLLDDFTYATITDYVPVAPGNYDIRVVAGGTTAINVENFNLAAGSVSTVIARQPNGTGTPSDFSLVVLTN